MAKLYTIDNVLKGANSIANTTHGYALPLNRVELAEAVLETVLPDIVNQLADQAEVYNRSFADWLRERAMDTE